MSSSFDRRMQRRAAVAGRLLETFVFAPIGAGAKLVTDGPGVVARARQELSNARFIGEMVVEQGTAQLKERLAQRPSPESDEGVPQPPEESEHVAVTDSITEAPDADVVADEQPADPATPRPVADEPETLGADDLAIPDYDSLPAIDIVGQLESLTLSELQTVERYERANRRRRTVLGKVSQLSGPA